MRNEQSAFVDILGLDMDLPKIFADHRGLLDVRKKQTRTRLRRESPAKKKVLKKRRPVVDDGDKDQQDGC